MQLAMEFQTPILKYFYPLESDIVSGEGLKKSEKIFKDKKIVFSKNIVHFDGLKLESLKDIQKGEHHKFWHDDEGGLQTSSVSNENKSGEEKKDEGGKRVGDNNETQLKDDKRHLIVTENVLFTHDDRSVRPVLLV